MEHLLLWLIAESTRADQSQKSCLLFAMKFRSSHLQMNFDCNSSIFYWYTIRNNVNKQQKQRKITFQSLSDLIASVYDINYRCQVTTLSFVVFIQKLKSTNTHSIRVDWHLEHQFFTCKQDWRHREVKMDSIWWKN